MDKACSTGRIRGMHVRYWWESQKERDHQEALDVCGWIILKWILDKMRYYRLD
jgi:hypothetical protein